ncbi:hypothetical protein [Bordetella avium]|uniref:hypothetical protein n=1 Tax=Bordetella avium TaxID=521 RepID=UPI000E68A568|nr:hypothetical protein [Bordetella avium]RIQ51019.1 hypothetical protein D0843_11040 [Bordetella avium]
MEKNELSCAAITGIFGVACLVGLFIWQIPASVGRSSDWAAWVQAFGSIGAIAAAISISRNGEIKREKERQRAATAEVQAFLLGVRHELDVQWRIYEEQVGDAVNSGWPYIAGIWPLPTLPFKFFRSQISMLGRVPDGTLMSALVEVYSEFEGLFVTWGQYNELYQGFLEQTQALDRLEVSDDEPYWNCRKPIEEYSKIVRRHHSTVKASLEKARRLLAATAQ